MVGIRVSVSSEVSRAGIIFVSFLHIGCDGGLASYSKSTGSSGHIRHVLVVVSLRLIVSGRYVVVVVLLSSHSKLIEAELWAYGHVWKSDVFLYGTMWEGPDYTRARPLGSMRRFGP